LRGVTFAAERRKPLRPASAVFEARAKLDNGWRSDQAPLSRERVTTAHPQK
jgi:hypothetical protein